MSDEEEEISRIVTGIRLRLDTLASIDDRNMMAPEQADVTLPPGH